MGIKFGKGDEFWKKQVDKIFTVVLGYRQDSYGYQHITWTKGTEKGDETLALDVEQTKKRLKEKFWEAKKQGHMVTLNEPARKLFTGKPNRYDVDVDVWEERDRFSIVVHYKDDHPLKPSADVVEWWDDDARQMFEDGFFDRRRLVASVLDYCEAVGLLRKAV